MPNPPQSIVTITDASNFERIAAYQISGWRIEITQHYGKYFVQVDTQGYSSIAFTLTINAPILAFDVKAPPSSLPIAFQKLLPETQVALQTDEAELFKESGKEMALGEDFASAITDYQKSLAIDPNDFETSNFLGYAQFRVGQLAQAEQTLTTVVRKHPKYDTARLNLVKVDCSESKMQDAKNNFAPLKAKSAIWKADGEFLHICSSLVSQ
jgi:tetratricopeptide (TPR) repeat protein